jgi:hypothetical protein
MDIKPIETIYNGYRFRSRLEARWAVFFDALGIRYEYEPEGFVLENGKSYLPDFFLPELKTYVEIKPAKTMELPHYDGMTEFENPKYAYATAAFTQADFAFLIAQGDPYDAFSHKTGSTDLFYIGECLNYYLAKTDKDGNIYKCEDGTICNECKRYKIPYHDKPVCIVLMDDGPAWVGADNPIFRCSIPYSVMRDNPEIFTSSAKNFIEALHKARQARFEHGETPLTQQSI